MFCEALSAYGAASRSGFRSGLAALDLARPPPGWVVDQTDGVRHAAMLGLRELKADAKPALPALRRFLAADTTPLQNRSVALQILRRLGLPPAEESRLCWDACRRAQQARPAAGWSPGRKRYYEGRRVELIRVSLEGAVRLGCLAADVRAELERLAAGTTARSAALAALVRIAWQDQQVRQRAFAELPRLGSDKLAGEAVLLDALAERGAEAGPMLPRLLEIVAMPRPPVRARHYLFEPALDALWKVGKSMPASQRLKLIADLVAIGNREGGAATEISRLCVRIDLPAAFQQRDAGEVGSRIVGDVMHLAPELLVPFLDDPARSRRLHTRQVLESYAKPTVAVMAAFRKLLSKSELRGPQELFWTLKRVGPTAAVLPALRPWLDRESVASRCLGTMRPPPSKLIEERLAQPTGRGGRGPWAANVGMIDEMKNLGAAGAVLIQSWWPRRDRTPRSASTCGGSCHSSACQASARCSR